MSVIATGIAPARTLATRLRGFVDLTKPRIIELLLVTTLPTMIVAAGGWPGWDLALATLAGGTLAAGGANAVNMYLDRDIDAVMRRTRGRPLVTGVVSPSEALAFAVTIEVVAFVELWALVNPLSAVLAVSATLFYVFVYTLWLKRRSPHNIVIGGAAGAVPVLVGWSAVTGALGWPPLLLFALVFLWTPPHFWALAIRCKEDYRSVDVPMLPVVSSIGVTTTRILRYSVAVALVSLLFGWVADMSPIYWLPTTAAGAAMCIMALDLHRNPGEERAMRLFHWSIAYITVVFAALALDGLIMG